MRTSRMSLMVLVLAAAATAAVTGCGRSPFARKGERPGWLNELSAEDRYGYGMSRSVGNPGPLVSRYSFAQKDTKITGDSRTSFQKSVQIQGRTFSTLARTVDAVDAEVDSASAQKLYDEQLIHLSNAPSGSAAFQNWSPEKAFYLYKTVENLPASSNMDAGIVSVFLLSSKPEAAQITEINEPAGVKKFQKARFYKVSGGAFSYASVKDLFGNKAIKAKYLDNDFFKQYLSMFLYDAAKLSSLLEAQYGYRSKGGEPAYLYVDFTVEELLLIICLLEDLPPFFKPIQGVSQFLRHHSADGAGLKKTIEYRDNALHFYLAGFTKITVQDFQAKLVSELAKAWYSFTLDRAKIADWQKLSGWHTLPDGRWAPTRTDNLVSNDALCGPEADFAESVAHYVVFPTNLLQKAREKYDFIFAIMDGYQYRVTAADQNRFQVISANPDMTAPVADLDSLEIDVHVNEDGYYTVKVRMNVTDDISGVAGGSISIFAAKYPKHKACGYFQRTGRGNQMEAVLTISRYAEKGKWNLSAVIFSDQVRNVARYTSENLGWDLTLPDNGFPVDKEAPTFNLDTLKLTYYWSEEDRMHEVYAEIDVTDNLSERLFGNLSAALESDYAWSEFLGYDPKKKKMYFVLKINEFQRSGDWRIYFLGVTDELCNGTSVYMDAIGRKFTFNIQNSQVDTKAPKIRSEGISLKFTDHDPNGHNGSYTVDVWVPVSDDVSGVAFVTATVMSPSGQQWSGGAMGEYVPGGGRKLSSDGGGRRPQGWGKPGGYNGSTEVNGQENLFHIQIELPAHIEGGTWILASITASDRAKNYAYKDLTTRGISISK